MNTELKNLCQQLTLIHKKMEELGMFMDDRELLECESCQLLENVDVYGYLFVCHATSLNKKIDGYVFKPSACHSGDIFLCPKCGVEVVAEIF